MGILQVSPSVPAATYSNPVTNLSLLQSVSQSSHVTPRLMSSLAATTRFFTAHCPTQPSPGRIGAPQTHTHSRYGQSSSGGHLRSCALPYRNTHGVYSTKGHSLPPRQVRILEPSSSSA
ncbi:hypothetical protein BC628DRAFT_105116 [Trametes gibbosa]|nr:hypothetical protein BC628DRAFT_620192 [Trametes gibbosa]KAI0828242.1 hypothetical protein BC628DRAFT_105116 [Trametes gibbosa]